MAKAALALLLLCGAALAAPTVRLAPLHRPAKGVIPGSYMVVLHEDLETADLKAFAQSVDAGRFMQIGNRFKAFSGVFSESLIAKIRARTDLVKFVEHDHVFETTARQSNATWGLDRSDQVNLPLDTYFNYVNSAGANVDAYIIDTGIRTTHNDFGGRAIQGYNFHDDTDDATDDNGHGTHVAGTVGSATYGLAKSCRLVAVKVLGRLGSGSLTNVAAGVTWSAENAASTGRRSVANLSLGGSASASLDAAVAAAIADGLTTVVASGNSNDDACDYSPARVATAITVNASNKNDVRASFSNYGTCTTLFAPGESILSTAYNSDSATATLSGTSMASPHVAGAVALLLGQSAYTPAQAKSAIIANASANKITNPGSGSPNRLLYAPY